MVNRKRMSIEQALSTIRKGLPEFNVECRSRDFGNRVDVDVYNEDGLLTRVRGALMAGFRSPSRCHGLIGWIREHTEKRRQPIVAPATSLRR